MKPSPPTMEEKPIENTDATNNKEDEASQVMSINSDTHREQLLNVLEGILDRIGVGKYQIFAYLTSGLASLIDGANLATMSLLNYIFVHSKSTLTEKQASMIASIYAVGFLIGNLSSGYFIDSYGRAKVFRVVVFAMIIPLFAVGLSHSFAVLTVFQGIFGFLTSTGVGSSIVLQQEISPIHFRVRSYLLFPALMYTTGELITISLAQGFNVEETNSEGWRILVLWMCVPALIGGLLGVFKLKETARFVLEYDYRQALQIIKAMFKTNHGEEFEPTNDEKNSLKEWSSIQKRVKQESSYKMLFDPKIRSTFFCLSILTFCIFMVFYCIVYVLPLLLSIGGDNEKGIKFVTFYFLAATEVPSALVASLIVEHPKLGRKNSILYCLLGASFSLLGFCFNKGVGFLLLAKFFIATAYDILLPFIAESFNTKIRGTGLTCVSLFGGMALILYPQIVARLFERDRTMYFVLLICFAIIAILSVLMLPHDTRGKPLDIHPSQIERKIENESMEDKDWLLNEEQEQGT